MNFRKIFILICAVCLLFAAAACDNVGSGGTEELTLSDEDKELLEKVGDDLYIVDDENYVDTVLDFEKNGAALAGGIYSIEGLVTHKSSDGEGTAFLYRNYNDGETVSELGVEVRYLPEEVKDGDFIKMTGILSEVTHEGHSHIYLDVVTVETPRVHGSETLTR